MTTSATREALDRLVADLRSALDNHLQAVVARRAGNEWDVIVVLADVAPATLRKISAPMRSAWRSVRLSPVVTTSDEISSAADVFPVRYRAFQRDHELLFGEDPFAGLTIDASHLRLRTEQELRNLAMRLRRRFALVAGDALGERRLLEETAQRLALPVCALLELTGEAAAYDASHHALFDAWATRDEQHAVAFRGLAEIARDEYTGATSDLLEHVLSGVTAAAERADRLEEPS